MKLIIHSWLVLTYLLLLVSTILHVFTLLTKDLEHFAGFVVGRRMRCSKTVLKKSLMNKR